ncbi:MAG: IS110 family transposase [Polyangiaceae bacterium]
MEVLYPRCAGLDVHRDTVVACARVAVDRTVSEDVRTFGTTTTELMALSAWLTERGISHVAMEATGVYWRPVWHVLEGDFELVLANAMHIKNVPGRKTDVNDATWIASLLAHGLIRSSFVPPAEIQDLRALTRTRKQLVREQVSHVQRIDKILQDANLKLGSVLADIMGRSGRAILDALAAGETDPTKLLVHVHQRVKAPRAAILEALRGKVTANHRFLLKLHLAQVDALKAAIDAVDQEVGERLAPFRVAGERLTQIPGISEVSSAAIVSEIGVDMSRFPTAGHLISWAGLCPANDESAGKKRSARLRKGAPWLKTLLVQNAWGAARTKGSYLQAQFQRLRARRGPRKAIIAVAASMLTAIYFMLKNGLDYVDLGADHFNAMNRTKAANRLLRKLDDLGFEVDGLREKTAA